MNWSTIWELVKINILYSSPQTIAAIKKKQEKNPQRHYVAYKETLKQQAMMVLMFLFVYIFMFLQQIIKYILLNTSFTKFQLPVPCRT